MAMKTMKLGKLSVWIIVVIHVFHFGAGETFKFIKGGCSNYTFHGNSPPLLWEQSRVLCKKTGLGDLVSIESKKEWTFLKNTILNLTMADEYFIGLRKDGRSGQWGWLSNKNTSQTGLPWALREPNGDGNCATMYKNYRGDHGKYNDLGCTTHAGPGYICEFPVDRCKQEDGVKRCSCYTFVNDTPMLWPQAQGSCKFNNEHLVVMETEREWDFITNEIQTRKSGKENEWHIGLNKNLTTRKWTWINGKTVTIDKWQKDQPQDGDFYTLMARESSDGVKGSFSSIKGNINRGWICEKQTDNCQGVCLTHNPMPTSSTPSGTTKSNTQWVSDSSTLHDRTTTSDSTATSSGAEGSEVDNDTIVIVVASLGAVLFVVLVVLVVVLLLRRRKRPGHEKDEETPPKKSTHPPARLGENQYEPVDRAEVAKLLVTSDNNKTEKKTEHESPPANCEYAVVNKKNKKRKEGDLVYAQLAEFDGANNDKTAQKPPSYEPTVYADVDVVPPEMFNSTSGDSTQPTYANVETTGV